ncbi:MAG: hypothetical protein JNL11_20555 [Bdellovibrionaceae bacterium]|nr:hypothetical protein [Pseudobdellovibrionaceae bacterium]
MIIKLAFKELFVKWKWSLIFIFNLAFGFIGFTTVLSFQNAIEENAKANSKQILSADLAISSRKKIPDSEITKTENYLAKNKINYTRTKVTEFFAMVTSGTRSHLVLVKAIDNLYPLYGELILTRSTIQNHSPKPIFDGPSIWAYSELQGILGVEIGSTLKLGSLDLKVDDFITKDATQTFRLASLAPRIFIDSTWLEKSKLITFGSTFTEAYLYKFDTDSAANIQKDLFALINDPAIQIDTPTTASEDSARQLGFLTDFLNLVALVAILLAGLGASYLYQVFARKKVKDFAIFKILGLSYVSLVKIYILQLIVLSFLVCVVSYIGSLSFLPFLQWILSSLVTQTLDVQIPVYVVGLTLALTFIASLIVVGPSIQALNKVPPGLLFKDDNNEIFKSSKNIFSFVVALCLMGFLTLLLTRSLMMTSIFIISIAGLAALFYAVGNGIIFLLGKLPIRFWVYKYAIKSLQRRKSTSLVLFSTIGTAILLLNLLPQLKHSLKDEFLTKGNSQLPSLFLFDIQDEQIDPLRTLIKQNNKDISQLSPIVRSRIIKINDTPYERKVDFSAFKTREEERDARSRNRGVNLTYRDHLSSSETLTDGIPLSEYKGELPGLSLEERYAGRMGIKLGDIIEFDIQGVEIKGKVINFRKVKWASFQPNFFISFGSGVLDDAPKTSIGIVNGLNDAEVASIISQVTKNLPNVSVIDVRQLIKDLLRVSDQMTLSLELMAYLSLITGFIVLISLISIQLQDRRWEINLFKILGSPNSSINLNLLFEYGVVVLFSVVLGISFSFLVSFLTLKFTFDAEFSFNFKDSFYISLAVILIAMVIIQYMTSVYLSKRSNEILKESS